MDKSWISEDRDTLEYEVGVEKFLIYAEENADNLKKIPCPCSHCVNFKKFSIKIIQGCCPVTFTIVEGGLNTIVQFLSN